MALFEQMLDEVRTMGFDEYQGAKRLSQQDSQLPARLRSSVEVGVRFFRAVQAAWCVKPSPPSLSLPPAPPPRPLSVSLCALRQLLVNNACQGGCIVRRERGQRGRGVQPKRDCRSSAEVQRIMGKLHWLSAQLSNSEFWTVRVNNLGTAPH